ncbi:GNAT family N-acetyltransferase [Streptomyces flavofungini]|uniref:GNAT family N-acetyltransferase n=1 Tax=Streptomyces flavofungini TaxID=68200 RepID=UPI0025B0DE9A|nr:GNAT family N-acetyltransferase [Streptomyces flavofungini]WJV50255.1 GNAT family N-acetyltransferase [Streptomyces flavofungini]
MIPLPQHRLPAFDRLVPDERMVCLHHEHVAAPRPPRGVRVRRVTDDDALALAALWPDSDWIPASWGGPSALAAPGHAVAAFDRSDRGVAVACSCFGGDSYEDVAVATAPEHRRKGLARARVAALTADVSARGRTASWPCARDNRPSRPLARTIGFRLCREYTHYVTGDTSRGTGATVRAEVRESAVQGSVPPQATPRMSMKTPA